MQYTIDTSALEYISSLQHRFSIEVFPPKTEEKTKQLLNIVNTFVTLGIHTVNVTCKPGDSAPTLELVHRMRREIPSVVLIPHIAVFSLIDGSLDTLLKEYISLGIRNVFLIRGDLPDSEYKHEVQATHAHVLVAYVKEYCKDLSVGVAAYPEQHHEEPNFIVAMQHLKQKVDAGADYIITQLFFDNRHYDNFVQCCSLFGIDIPIIPGITYLKNKQHIEKMSSLSLGTTIPYQLMRDVYHNNEHEALILGKDWCKQQSKELLQKKYTPQLHFYIFNELSPFDSIIHSAQRNETVV